MRTTLDIDDALMAALLERKPGASKTEAIEQALKEYLEDDAIGRLVALAGSFEIEDVSAERQATDRHT